MWSDAADRTRVWQALDKYPSADEGDSTEEGRARVQLAILKLAAGSIAAVEDGVEVAVNDFRDVLAAAEYPEEFTATWAVRPRLSSEEHARLEEIRERDRQNYVKWLENGEQ
jgi:hypothetical protein